MTATAIQIHQVKDRLKRCHIRAKAIAAVSTLDEIQASWNVDRCTARVIQERCIEEVSAFWRFHDNAWGRA